MATSPIYSWPEPDNTDLVKNGALAIRTLGNAIDTTMGTMVPKTIVDAKADLIVGTAADTVSRLAVGTNGQVLTADSTVSPTGLKWATPSAGGGGKVLQVVTDTTSTEESTTSSSYVDTALSLSITPSATTSKVLVILSATGSSQRLNDQNARANFNIVRTTNQLAETVFGLDIEDTVIGLVDKINLRSGQNIIYLDSPSTTSATTYKTQIRATSGYGTAYLSPNNSFSSLTLIEIGA